MDSTSHPKTLASWKVRMFGFALVVFGGFMSAFGWIALQRPDIKITSQEEYTADPDSKRRGIWGSLILCGLGLPILFAPSRWLDPSRGAAARRQP
ncbi:hypothetical protein [Geothrix edaphica]|uniref:hypothetical protein n=1 Tax=Geothrix edaphica TaxID=2927976 RepID=UPI002554EBEB|nr:hypothetical protein [Geothrix edaphica]